jgi:hypothetical protein
MVVLSAIFSIQLHVLKKTAESEGCRTPRLDDYRWGGIAATSGVRAISHYVVVPGWNRSNYFTFMSRLCVLTLPAAS